MLAKKEKPVKTKGPAVRTNLLDTIAPICFEQFAGHADLGEVFVRTLIIIEYPPGVGPGWLAKVASLPGVVFNQFITPITDTYKLIKQINKTMGELEGKLIGGTNNPIIIDRTQRALGNAKKLFQKIDQEQQSVFYCLTLIAVVAADQKELDKRVRSVEGSIAAQGMRPRGLMFKQEKGFIAAGPWFETFDEIDQIGARNVPAETIAAAMPFTATNLNDGSGFILGRDKKNEVVIMDIWRRGGDRANSNWAVLGVAGSGKSTTVKKILVNEYARGTKIIIIDPEREYRDICNNMKGSWIDCGGGRGVINPLQAWSVPEDDEEGDTKETRKMGPVALHLTTFETFINTYSGDALSETEKTLLKQTLIELYNRFGITNETDPGDVPAGKWPCTNDLYTLICERAEAEPEKWEKLKMFFWNFSKGDGVKIETPEFIIWGGHTTIQAENDFIVLDIKSLEGHSEKIKRAQFFNVLTWAWNEVTRDRKEKVLLVVDEAWMLIDPKTPETLKFLLNASKRIRKYMGSLMVSSQQLVDFIDPSVRKVGQPIIDNPTYKFLMHMGENDLAALKILMNLSEQEEVILSKAARGEGLLVAGNKRTQAFVELADFEPEIFGEGGGK